MTRVIVQMKPDRYFVDGVCLYSTDYADRNSIWYGSEGEKTLIMTKVPTGVRNHPWFLEALENGRVEIING